MNEVGIITMLKESNAICTDSFEFVLNLQLTSCGVLCRLQAAERMLCRLD